MTGIAAVRTVAGYRDHEQRRKTVCLRLHAAARVCLRYRHPRQMARCAPEACRSSTVDRDQEVTEILRDRDLAPGASPLPFGNEDDALARDRVGEKSRREPLRGKSIDRGDVERGAEHLQRNWDRRVLPNTRDRLTSTRLRASSFIQRLL